MEKIKKVLSVVLIVSLILTSHSFYTFADSIEKSLETSATQTKWEVEQDIYKSSEDVEDIESKDLDFVNLSDEIVSASISDTTIFDDENENTDESFEEEPEEDPAVEELEEEMTTEEAGVEASSASIEEETSIEETTIEETTIDEITVEETTIDEITVEETTIDETTVEETTIEETTIDETTVEETTIEETMIDETTIEETTAEETTTVGASSASPEETTTVEETTVAEKSAIVEVSAESLNEEVLTATMSELQERIAKLLEINKFKREVNKDLNLFGGDFPDPVLSAYLSVVTVNNANYPDGYGALSRSFAERFPQMEIQFYNLEQGEGDDYKDGDMLDFTYPTKGNFNDWGGVYVVDGEGKPAYKLSGWKYKQEDELHDFPNDIKKLDEDSFWEYESLGYDNDDFSKKDWIHQEVEWSRLTVALDYFNPYHDVIYLYLIPQWTPISDEDEVYYVKVDSKKDIDYAEMTKSYPDNFYVSKKNDSECYTNLEDKYFDVAATDTGFTIDYENKTITLHSNTAKVDDVTGEAFTCNEYKVDDRTFGVETPIPFNDFFGNSRTVTLTPVWVRSHHTITIKYFDYKENIDFNTDTPVGTKELSYHHGQTSFIDLRNERLLLDLYKDAEASVFSSDPSFAYNANIDIDNPSATDGILRYSLYKESHSDTIYMEKGRTILVGDATINLCIKRGATLKWTSKQHSNDYTTKFKDKNENYVNIKNGRLPKFSEIPNTGIVLNFIITTYEHKNSSATYYAAIDEAPITSSEQLEVFVSGTGELPGYPTVESFIIATPPNFVDYKSGDAFDPSGLGIVVTYEGVAETRNVLYDEHKSEFIFNPTLEDRIQPTDTHVAITFGGYTVNQAISVDVSPHERALYWWLEDLPDYSSYGDDKKLHLTSVYAEGRKMISGTGPINYDGMTEHTRKRQIRLVSIDDIIVPETCEDMFMDFEYLDKIENLANLDTNKAVSMRRMFKNAGNTDLLEPVLNLYFNNFDTSNVTDMSEMFADFNIRNLDLSSFDTSKVTTMASMFAGSDCLTNLDVSSFDTSNVEDMSLMFFNCQSLSNLDVSHFDTGNVKDMNKMFYNCSGLKNLDFSEYKRFDTSNVTNMHEMFSKVDSERIILTNFITSNVTDMGSMFAICGNLKEIDISSFDTSSLTNMQNMFYSSGNLTQLDLSSFDTSRVTNMHSLFEDCHSLKTIYASDTFVTDALGDGDNRTNLFSNCENLVGGNGTEWDEYHTTYLRAKIDEAGDPGYFTGRERDAVLRSIEIINAPDKIRYNVAEHFDPSGLTIKLCYSDGITKNVAYNDFTKSKFRFSPATVSELQAFDFVVSIRYENAIAFQEIFVTDSTDRTTDIAVEKKPNKTSYIVGEHIDLTGLVLRMRFSDNKIISLSYEDKFVQSIVKYDDRALNSLDKYVTVEVFGATTNIPITVRSSSNPSGGGSSSGGSDPTRGPMGDLTKNPAYQYLLNEYLNTTNNITNASTINNSELKSVLNLYPENINMPFTNIRDAKGNTGFGKWQKVPGTGTWYFIVGDNNSTSFASNGWFNLSWKGESSWYHFDVNGTMQIGWFVDSDGKWYYLDSNQSSSNYGRMLIGGQVVDGTVRNFDANGALIS